jgi:hypothetical protein
MVRSSRVHGRVCVSVVLTRIRELACVALMCVDARTGKLGAGQCAMQCSEGQWE